MGPGERAAGDCAGQPGFSTERQLDCQEQKRCSQNRGGPGRHGQNVRQRKEQDEGNRRAIAHRQQKLGPRDAVDARMVGKV